MNKKEAINSDNNVISSLAYHDIYIRNGTAKIIECYMVKPEMSVCDVSHFTGLDTISIYGVLLKLKHMGVVEIVKRGRKYERINVDPEDKFGIW